jgi:hypothetical protein
VAAFLHAAVLQRCGPPDFCRKDQEMSDRNLEIIEIDRRLAADPAGVELKALIERLVAGKGRVVQALDRGVGAEDYARLTSLSQAYDAGVEALPKLWASIHHPQ